MSQPTKIMLDKRKKTTCDIARHYVRASIDEAEDCRVGDVSGGVWIGPARGGVVYPRHIPRS
jgi:hypothetical protein